MINKVTISVDEYLELLKIKNKSKLKKDYDVLKLEFSDMKNNFDYLIDCIERVQYEKEKMREFENQKLQKARKEILSKSLFQLWKLKRSQND